MVDFFNCSAWNQLGESCQKYLAKGRKVAVVGSVSVRTYQGNDGAARASLDVLAGEVEFLTSAQSAGGNGTATGAANGTVAATAAAGNVVPNLTPVDAGDELPF